MTSCKTTGVLGRYKAYDRLRIIGTACCPTCAWHLHVPSGNARLDIEADFLANTGISGISGASKFLTKSHSRLSISSLGSSRRSSDGRIIPIQMAGAILQRTAHHISWLQRPIAASTLSRKPPIHLPSINAAIAGSRTIPSSRPRTVIGHSGP